MCKLYVKNTSIKQKKFSGPQNDYNLYASCYELPIYDNSRPELVKPYYAKKGFEDQAVCEYVHISLRPAFLWSSYSYSESLSA